MTDRRRPERPDARLSPQVEAAMTDDWTACSSGSSALDRALTNVIGVRRPGGSARTA